MSVDIPQPFKTKLVSPVTIDGIPDTFNMHIKELPTISLSVEKLPEIHLSIDNIPKIQLGVDPVEIRLTEFPSIRGHLPADFNVGLSVMGFELMNVRLCGEAQIITEPYHPNPCEVCGGVHRPVPVGIADRAEDADVVVPGKVG
jgi:hypothetical protein